MLLSNRQTKKLRAILDSQKIKYTDEDVHSIGIKIARLVLLKELGLKERPDHETK